MKRLILCFLLCAGLLVGADAGSQKMNVLFIAVDDLRPQLGCYGQTQIRSPHIDRLASEGILFERAYCQQAVCAPSRASLLTGLRPDTTGIYDLQHPVRETLPDVLTLPEYYRRHGYTALSLGKIYHHREDDNGKGWSEDAWWPEGNWTGRGYLSKDGKALAAADAEGRGPAFEAAEVADGEYPDGKIAEEAVARLRAFKNDGAPFFLAVGFIKPHLPFNAPQKYWDLYPPDTIRIPDRKAWPDRMPSFAGTGIWEISGYKGVPKKLPFPDGYARELVRGYYACVSYTDALIGKVLDELDRLGLRDSTVIVLWGDHGWKLGDYGHWCKHTNFEIDTHVPLILSAPRVATAGERTGALVEFVDIYPTLAELCGLPIPGHCEGTSMVPLLRDPSTPWKRAAFSQYPRGKRMGYSIRSGKWRYTEWLNRASGKVVARELYDHTDGPVADRNLARDAEHADTVKALSELLAKGKGWKAARVALGQGTLND